LLGRLRALASLQRRSRCEGSPLESPRFHRKDRQLCRQVQRTLEVALLELEDPALLGIHLLEVTPAPDASRLRVVLACARASDRATRAGISDALNRVGTRLRAAVAQAAMRRRVPELCFVLSSGEAR
jgi:ribosome-binding factor A